MLIRELIGQMRRPGHAVACWLAAVAACNTQTGSAQACAGEDQAVTISSDSLGALPLWAPIGHLREACPDAQAGTYVTPVDRRELPAVRLSIGELAVSAVQYGTIVRDELPADYWVLSGPDGRLPRGLPTDASWGSLRETYAGPEGSTESGSTRVVFSEIPQFTFVLDADPATVGSIEVTGDLSRIPADSRVVQVLIVAR